MSIAIATPEELDLSADDPTYEVIDGVRVELPPMGMEETLIATALGHALLSYTRPRRLGRVVNEGLFALRTGSRLNRRPDVAFVSYERWPRERRVDRGNAWRVVPDLMVEVVSPGNYANEIPERVRDYFEVGSLRVWLVYPTVRLIYLYESPRVIRVVGQGEWIEDEALFPGLRIPIDDLFEDLGEADPDPTS